MTNKVYENFNFITPLKINSQEGIEEFFNTMRTFYGKLNQPYPVHYIKDDSDQKIKIELKKRCAKISSNIIFIEENKKTNMTEAVELLVKNVDKKYLFLLLADVIMLEDFLDASIEAMNADEELMEICVGGSFFHRGRSNKEFIKIIENEFYIDRNLIADTNRDPNLIKFVPTYFDNNNTVWKSHMKCDLFCNFHYLMAMWNCIIRSSFCKRVFNDIRTVYNPNAPALDNFTKRVCCDDEITRLNYPPNLPSNWHKEFEWMTDCKFGVLNFCPYIYPNGRGDISLEKFNLDYRNKIKTIGDL